MPAPRARHAVLLLLALLLIATRADHFGPLPDASWAVFFLAGFYLRGFLLTSFALLMATAVLVDWWVITSQGLDFFAHYCVSPAYWFLLPSYAVLTAGGWWLSERADGDLKRAIRWLPVSLVAAVSLCFLLSNGSFYWLSGVVAAPSFGGWLTNMGHWFLPYLGTTALYVAIAALLHGMLYAFLRALPLARDLQEH